MNVICVEIKEYEAGNGNDGRDAKERNGGGAPAHIRDQVVHRERLAVRYRKGDGGEEKRGGEEGDAEAAQPALGRDLALQELGVAALAHQRARNRHGQLRRKLQNIALQRTRYLAISPVAPLQHRCINKRFNYAY